MKVLISVARSCAVWIALVSSLSLAAPALADFDGILEPDTNRLGGDYASFPTTSVADCMQACADHGRACVAFTHVPSTGTCWLKDMLYGRSDAKGMTSGVKPSAFRYLTAEADTDRPGGDYRSGPLDGGSPALCAEQCQGDSRCLAYTFVPPRNGSPAWCWLKNSKPKPRSATGLVSGTKPGHAARRNTMTITADTRRTGADYKRYEMVSRDPDACRTLCGTVSSCEAWTFDPYPWVPTLLLPGTEPSPKGICYLQPAAGREKASPGSFSGRRSKGFERPHHPNARVRTVVIPGEFDGALFAQRLRNRLNRFQGYGLVVLDPAGSEVVAMEDGYAVHPMTGEAARRFTVDTPTRIGSISKVVTAVAVLVHERYRPGFIDTQLGDVVPYRWREWDDQGLNAVFRDVTFRLLLQHRAGLPLGGVLRDVLAGPEIVPPGTTVEYSNSGVETFNLTMAYALYSDFMHLMESGSADLSEADYDENIRGITSSMFRSTLSWDLAPAGVEINCHTGDTVDPSLFYSENFMNYSTIDYSSPGIDDLDLHCAQGALVMSTRDLARLFDTVMNTDEILSKRERDLLTSPDDAIRIAMGAVRRYDDGTIVAEKNGGHPGNPVYAVRDGNLGSYSELLLFPDGYVVAFNANSPQKEGESALDEIIAAFEDAHNPAIGPQPFGLGAVSRAEPSEGFVGTVSGPRLIGSKTD